MDNNYSIRFIMRFTLTKYQISLEIFNIGQFSSMLIFWTFIFPKNRNKSFYYILVTQYYFMKHRKDIVVI
jgi:hypothetical protein